MRVLDPNGGDVQPVRKSKHEEQVMQEQFVAIEWGAFGIAVRRALDFFRPPTKERPC